MREFKYLGYTLMGNGGQEAHIRERVRKAAAVMGQVWGLIRGNLERIGGKGCGCLIG